MIFSILSFYFILLSTLFDVWLWLLLLFFLYFYRYFFFCWNHKKALLNKQSRKPSLFSNLNALCINVFLSWTFYDAKIDIFYCNHAQSIFLSMIFLTSILYCSCLTGSGKKNIKINQDFFSHQTYFFKN